MNCTINFKGTEYSEEQFSEYLDNNIEDVVNLMPVSIGEDLNSNKYSTPLVDINTQGASILGELTTSILPKLSSKVKEEIASKFNIDIDSSVFNDAVSREINDSLYKRRSNEVTKLAKAELIQAFSSLSTKDLNDLQGFERSLYNISTNQQTTYKQYPKIKQNEIAFSVDGEWNIFNREELINKVKNKEIDINSIEGLPTFITNQVIYEDKATQTVRNDIDYSKILSENDKKDLSRKLFKTLEKLGFSTMKLSDYINSYKQKNGVDPSVNALADIVNRVVAISDTNDMSLLSEEVAHILTETYNNQDEIREILPEVENTDMWAEHSARYFALYEGKGLSNEQLTEKVRREILAKLISEKITKGDTSTSTLQKVGNIVSRFFSKIKSFITPSLKTRLDDITTRIANSINEEENIQKMFNTDNLKENIFGEFYNAGESALTQKLNDLVRNSRMLATKKRGSITPKVDRLATIVADPSSTIFDNLKAISYYLDITNSVQRDVMTKIKTYEEAVKNGNTPKSFLSAIDTASINILVTENLPHLQFLKSSLNNLEAPSTLTAQELKDFNSIKSTLRTQIDSLVTDVNSIKGDVLLKNAISGESLLQTMVDEYNVSPEAAREITDYLKTTHSDISTLQMFFGNLQHAPNPILALMGRLIGDLTHKTDVATKHFSRDFIDKLNRLGIKQENYQKFFDRLIQKDRNGKITGYLKSVIDWGTFELAKKANDIQAYNDANQAYINEYNATSTSPMTYEPISDLNQIGTKPNFPRITSFTGNSKDIYNKVIQDWRDSNLEQPYNVSFRKQREEMIDSIVTKGITLPNGTYVNEVPREVLDMMAGWASRRREIKSPYIKNGVLDYTHLSEAEKTELDSIKRERLELKSLVDPITGEMKSDREQKVALALQAIEQYYIQNSNSSTGKRKVNTEFSERLKSITNPAQAFEWFAKNSGLSFNQNFWKKLEEASESSSNKFLTAIEKADILDSEKEDLKMKVEELENLLKRRSQFLKQFKNPTSPAEIDTSIMGDGSKDVFLNIEEDIETLFKELNGSLKEFTGTTVRDTTKTESTANESFQRDYEAYLKDNPTGDIVKFSKFHSTTDNFSAIGSFNKNLKRWETTGNLPTQGSFKNSVINLLGLPSTASSVEIANALTDYKLKHGSYDILLENFVKTKLAGYYKRFAPKGFTSFYEEMKSGSIKDEAGNTYTLAEVIDIIREENPKGIKFPNDITDYLDINAEVEWMEDESSLNKNPNFIESVDGISTNYGGYGQPKRSIYLNNEFVNEYNIDLDVYFSTGETVSKTTSPERKKELYLLQYLVASRHSNFEKQNVAGIANAYSLPGVRKATVEKGKAFIANPLKATKEAYKDFIDNSVDKKLYGESSTGEIDNDPGDVSRLVVPTLNVQALERIEDTTTDLLYSYTVHTYNANLFENRQEALSKANQLESILLSRDFKDKSAVNSNVYTAFQDFKKAFILGVHETRRIKVNMFGKQVDLTNLLRTMDAALGTVNVGLNPAISITAATSGLTFSTTEALVGQYMTADSFRKGSARFHAKAGSFLSETGQVDKTNEVYLFGERFGLYTVLNGVENTGENRFIRTLFKDGVGGMAHIMTEMMTKPFAPSIMYATLDNMRFATYTDSEGNQQYQLMSFLAFKEANPKKTRGELTTMWKSFEKNSLLNNISVENGMVKYSDRFDSEFLAGLSTEEKEKRIHSIELDVRNQVSTTISKVDAKMPMHDKSMASRNALARFLLRHREWFTINFQNRFKRRHHNLYTGQYEEGHYHTLARFLKDSFVAFNPKNDTKLREVFETLTPTEKLNLKRVLIDTAISVVLVSLGSLVVAPWGDDDENKDNSKVQFLAYMYYRLVSEQMSSGIAGVPAYKDVLESPFVAVNSVKQIMKPSNWSLEQVENGAYEGHSKIFRLAAKNTFLRHYYDLVHGLQQKSDFYRLNNEWTLWGMQKTSKAEKEEQKQYEKELEESYIQKTERFMR